ncbi:hypothetical protein BVX97_00520 [bacterium E08(2017)]|nr:hypothetical protein BVX97_00520 [bacterium E08(2017)]
MKNIVSWAVFLAILVLAIVFRSYELGERVLHNDEANQMVRAGRLIDKGEYIYDPVEHHGPTLYYLSLGAAVFSGGNDFASTTESSFRVIPAIFGIGLVLLLLTLRRELGWASVNAAAFLTAVSTCMVYYSRFYIQETLLVFFTFGSIVCGWRYFQSRNTWWAVGAGVCIGLMHATKETCVIAYAAMAAAFVVAVIWSKGIKLDKSDLDKLHVHLPVLVAAALVVSIVLFSSFFTNWRGVWDSVATYQIYFERGGGHNTDHVHPLYYYLQILTYVKNGGLEWSEGIILIMGLVGIVMVLLKARCLHAVDTGFARFMVVYTLLMTFVYSYIDYKTPWCMMSFLHGWIVLGGIGAAGMWALLGTWPLRTVWCVGMLLPVYNLAEQTCRATFRYGADKRNPYAYSHTVTDFLNLADRIDSIAEISPEQKDMLIVVVTNQQDAWPLPWYLRKYARKGFWNSVSDVPGEIKNPPIVVSSLDKEGEIDAYLGDSYQSEYWGLRNEVLLSLHIRRDLWDKFMETRTATP